MVWGAGHVTPSPRADSFNGAIRTFSGAFAL